MKRILAAVMVLTALAALGGIGVASLYATRAQAACERQGADALKLRGLIYVCVAPDGTVSGLDGGTP